MKKTLFALILMLGIWAPAQAQGTFSTEGAVVDNVRSAVNAYLEQDWNAYRTAFADTAAFYPNMTEALTIDQNIEMHAQTYSLMEDVQFINPLYGTIENEGQTWGLMWGTWHGRMAATGQEFNIPVHIAILHVNGKGVAEYGFWDNEPISRAVEALQADM